MKKPKKKECPPYEELQTFETAIKWTIINKIKEYNKGRSDMETYYTTVLERLADEKEITKIVKEYIHYEPPTESEWGSTYIDEDNLTKAISTYIKEVKR